MTTQQGPPPSPEPTEPEDRCFPFVGYHTENCQCRGRTVTFSSPLTGEEREISLDEIQDVTVRLPVHFESIAQMAGFISGALSVAMDLRGWVGEPFILFRHEGKIVGFHQGLVDPYTGVLPHGLQERE